MNAEMGGEGKNESSPWRVTMGKTKGKKRGGERSEGRKGSGSRAAQGQEQESSMLARLGRIPKERAGRRGHAPGASPMGFV